MPSIAEKAIEEAFRALVIRITENSGNVLTDYQVKIVLNDTNFTDWDKVQSDGSDIFFLDENGNPLYFWIEEFDKTAKKATIWVKVPQIPANGETTIYMCYGGMENPFSSYHDLENVFDFFDDFADLTKWTEIKDGNSYIKVDNGVLQIYSDGMNRAYARTNTQFNAPFILEVKAKRVENIAIVVHWDGVIAGDYDNINNGYYAPRYRTWDPTPLFQIEKFENNVRIPLNDYEYDLDYNYHIYKVVCKNDGIDIYFDGSLILSTTDTTFTNGYIGLSGRERPAGKVAEYDWVRVRKYVDPEPSISIVESKFLAKHRIDLY